MWQLYETDKCNSESTSETKDLPPKFNDVLHIIGSKWKEMLEISNVSMLEKLLTKLKEHGLVDDFINLMYFLAYREMEINSIPVRTLLETANFYSLNDTQSMTYSPVTIDFWHVVLKCLGGPALQLFSGPRSRGVKTFNPKDCKINFAVPSWYTFQSRTKDIPKLIFPSIFRDVLST